MVGLSIRNLRKVVPVDLKEILMVQLKRVAIDLSIIGISTFLLFLIGYENEQFLGLGVEKGISRIHEFFHDLRHLAGFACH